MAPSFLINNKQYMKKIKIDHEVASKIYSFQGVDVHSPYQLYDGQKQYISYIIDCLIKGQNALVQSPTGTGKTLSLLLASLSWTNHCIKNRKEETRIIYTSRTHSQLKQIVKELKSSGYYPKISVLASKDQTCLNQDLKELSGNSKELQCRLRITKKNGLFCKFFHYDDFFHKLTSLGNIMDLQELSYKGKTEGFCPFFYEKTAKEIAHLILMPYNYVFDNRLWDEESAFITENSILIFDEGHNIQQVCEQTKQLSFNLSILSKGIQHISELRQLKLKQKFGTESQLKVSCHQIQMHAGFLCFLHEKLQSLSIPADQSGTLMQVSQLLEFINKEEEGEFGTIGSKINELCTSIVKIKNDIMLKPFWALDVWFQLLQKLQEFYKRNEKIVDYKCQIAYEGSDIKISFLCLDPETGFKRVLNLKPKSIILTSGTLTPLNTWGIQLGVQFAKPLACPHILSKDQINGCILTEGPNKVKLNFGFENRNRKELYVDLGHVLLQIAAKTSHGVLVFFPSYALLEKVKIELGNINILNRIYEKKSIFFEKKNSNDFKFTIDQFFKEAIKPKGAMLFALTRGKISQGLDFSNEKCRAVIMVGVPYPASKDLKVIAKRHFLDNKAEKTLTGDQWYLSETVRCINQSIGRIIRNKNDYGSIYLLDERFQRKQLLMQISSWARESLKIVKEYEDFALKIKLFNEYFMSKEKGVINLEEKNYFTSHLGTKIGSLDPKIKLIKGSISESLEKDKGEKNPIQERTKIEQIIGSIRTQDKKDDEARNREKLIFSRPSKKILLDDKKQCPVCRKQTKLIKNSECIHELCEPCWSEWLKQDLRCPICRVRVRQKYLIK